MNRSDEFKTRYLVPMADMMKGLNPGRNPGAGVYKYRSMEEAVVSEGHSFSDVPLSPSEEKPLRNVLRFMLRRERPQTKQCYMNAFNLCHAARMVEAGMGLTYSEGFGEHMIAAGHAWGSYLGRAIDVTWRESYKDTRYSVDAVLNRVRWNIVNCSYYGFEVPWDYVQKLVMRKRVYLSVLDNWEDRWPVVKHGVGVFVSGVEKGG